MWNEMTTPSILKEMGARLKEYRLRKGLMQSELAESVGVGVGTIAKMERGGAVSVQILLSTLRSLGMLENIGLLLPEPPVSPLLLRKLQGGKIQRIKRSKVK
jgi:transcriptional regulator with XRE-family HTH domain